MVLNSDDDSDYDSEASDDENEDYQANSNKRLSNLKTS